MTFVCGRDDTHHLFFLRLAPSGLHLVVVRGLVCFNETVSYMSAGVFTPGRSNQAEQVTVEIPDKRTVSFSLMFLASGASLNYFS
jgi:hypothetical protein